MSTQDGRGARPVTLQQIRATLGHLQTAAQRLEDAVKVMLDADLDEIEIRNHVTLVTGIKKIISMGSEVRDRAEDERDAKINGTPTKVQLNREHHNKYTKPKPAAKKKAKSSGNQTEGT